MARIELTTREFVGGAHDQIAKLVTAGMRTLEIHGNKIDGYKVFCCDAGGIGIYLNQKPATRVSELVANIIDQIGIELPCKVEQPFYS